MSTIEDQINLEKKMVAYGITRYRAEVDKANESGRAADSRYAQVLMREFITPVSDAVRDYCASTSAGPNAKYKVLISQIEPDKVAYFGLRCLFNHFIKESSLHKLSNHIGTMLEDELKFSKFHDKHGDYYEAIIEDFKRKGTQNYRHMHRVLTHKANEKCIQWASWGNEVKMAVGCKVIDLIMVSTDLVEKRDTYQRRKKMTEILPTPDSVQWIKDYHKYAEMLNPDLMPCVIQPDAWVGLNEGGFYTPQLRKRVPLVKTRSKKHNKMFDGDISNITDVVNAVQNVPWKINSQVLDVFKEAWDNSIPIGLPPSEPYIIPISPLKDKSKSDFTESDKILFDAWKSEARVVHTMERERVSKCFQVARIMRLANEFKDHDRFWFVHQCDFRGRVYATVSGLSPQGPEFAKALLCFSNGKKLTERGAYWLAVHGANCYGEDKCSYDDRVKWVQDNKDYIVKAATEPLSNKDFWASADKPWKFLAFCFEYARYLKEGSDMITYLPVALDGSCNGLQNFSAMLRDSIGGRATNLIPSEVPADIYAEVAKVCTNKLRYLDDEHAEVWKRFIDSTPGKSIPRGLAKRPVMTLPYGSTQQSCREYIYRYMVEDAGDFFDRKERFVLANYLTPLLWDSISHVVVAARGAMDWLQQCATDISKTDSSIVWWTPLGFPVLQDKKKIKTKQVETELAGRFRITVGNESNKSDGLKNKLGIAPNFVHSMDACHLMMTCRLAVSIGITDLAFIHDDYGTHAGDVDNLHRIIREAFLELYQENSPLIDFKIFNEDNASITLIDPPISGGLKLEEVLESPYFFG